MSFRNFIFEGHITAESPLACCPKNWADLSKKPKGLPLPIPKIMYRGDYRRLCFPASSLRGTLRRHTRDIVREYMIDLTGQDKPFTLTDHYWLTLGGIKQSGKEDKASVLDMEQTRAQNPLISLFGAGDPFIAGHLSIGYAVAIESISPVVLAGVRTDDLKRSPDQLRFLKTGEVDQMIEQAQGNARRAQLQKDIDALKIEIKKADKADKVALKESLAVMEGDLKAQKEETGDVSIGMPLAGWEAIPEGTQLHHRMALHNRLGTTAMLELGLLLSALSRFGLDPYVGAHRAHGCGLISAHWAVKEITPKGKTEIGTVCMNSFDELDLSDDPHGIFASAVDAWETAKASRSLEFRKNAPEPVATTSNTPQPAEAIT